MHHHTGEVLASRRSIFWQGCSIPLPYIFLLTPVQPHELPALDMNCDDSLRELGCRVCKGGVSP